MKEDNSSSFKTSRLNSSTFLIVEDTLYADRIQVFPRIRPESNPFIYAKINPEERLLILSDTGCNSPSKASAGCRFMHLRDYLENCPVACNDNKPLNPGPDRMRYMIICTNCHYDHTSGIPQFQQPSDETVIVASALGRESIESNLAEHGLFKHCGSKGWNDFPVPEYKVTHWARSFEWLDSSGGRNLQIQIIPTPGLTPDSLAWYDQKERYLFVGDSLHESYSKDVSSAWGAPVCFAGHGNLIDWYYSMNKLLAFVRKENAYHGYYRREPEAEQGWISWALHFFRWRPGYIPVSTEWYEFEDLKVDKPRVRLAAGHVTSSVDAEYMLEKALSFLGKMIRCEVPEDQIGRWGCDPLNMYSQPGNELYFVAPSDLVAVARHFFKDRYVVELDNPHNHQDSARTDEVQDNSREKDNQDSGSSLWDKASTVLV